MLIFSFNHLRVGVNSFGLRLMNSVSFFELFNPYLIFITSVIVKLSWHSLQKNLNCPNPSMNLITLLEWHLMQRIDYHSI